MFVYVCCYLCFVSDFVKLRTVNANVSKLFAAVGVNKGDGLTGSQVREHLVKYVKENNLQDPNNKAMVSLFA